MKISSEEFIREVHHPENRAINIFFEGMSGAGKSHWTRKFKDEFSWPSLDIDSAISEHPSISSQLQISTESDEQRLGRWLGSPEDIDYVERERLYLKAETDILQTLLRVRGHCIALSGSSVYHDSEMSSLQKDSGMVVYLESANSESLAEQYLNDGKPICWRGMFNSLPEESHEKAIRRLLPRLIEVRDRLYKTFADVVVPEHVHKPASTASELAKFISGELP